MRLPVLSGKEVIKALSKLGYYVRDRKGSHVHLRHPSRLWLDSPIADGRFACRLLKSLHLIIRIMWGFQERGLKGFLRGEIRFNRYAQRKNSFYGDFSKR
ncbi:MAG: YcfA-like protein [Candidatus Syntrophoarchaeum sp. GoM_oil]|nr:MAG: YcfA-like protein [Candidatus Syntrophoarchaeum sp. GoM_oil]